MSDYPIYAEGYVAELMPDGKVVVWPEETPDQVGENMSLYPPIKARHYFAVDVVLQPARKLIDEPEDDGWWATRWHRLIMADGTLWMETSDPEEIKRELSGEMYRVEMEDLAEGDEAPEPPPAGLVHQQLWQAPIDSEWRNVDGT